MVKKKKIRDFVVHPIGIGTWAVGGRMWASRRNDDKDIEAIRYSLKKGQNHIDTAEVYGAGHSEEIVGQAIKGFDRKDLFIATKVWRNNARVDKIPAAAESSLKRLDIDYVDLLYIHGCWNEGKIEEYIKGLNKAQDEGFTRAIGVSNFNLNQLEKAVSLTKNPIVALQNHYNLVHQYEVDEKMKQYCKANNITIVAYTPLEGCHENSVVSGIADKYKKTPAQIAINWLISQENVVTIPKSTDNTHIGENLGAMDFEIDEEGIKKLNSLGR